MRADVAGCRARRRRVMCLVFWSGLDCGVDRDHRQSQGGERRYGGTMDCIGVCTLQSAVAACWLAPSTEWSRRVLFPTCEVGAFHSFPLQGNVGIQFGVHSRFSERAFNRKQFLQHASVPLSGVLPPTASATAALCQSGTGRDRHLTQEVTLTRPFLPHAPTLHPLTLAFSDAREEYLAAKTGRGTGSKCGQAKGNNGRLNNGPCALHIQCKNSLLRFRPSSTSLGIHGSEWKGFSHMMENELFLLYFGVHHNMKPHINQATVWYYKKGPSISLSGIISMAS